jgi:ankyrin repeat protein
VRILIENKANINLIGHGDNTPLHFACKHTPAHIEIVKLILKSGFIYVLLLSIYLNIF